MSDVVYLSRRNLQTLLNKLDRAAAGEHNLCTIFKCDNAHPKYPQSMVEIKVVAVENDEYYAHRRAGAVHPDDDPMDVATRTNSAGPGGPTESDREKVKNWAGGPM